MSKSAKKKKLPQKTLEDQYWHFLLTTGKRPTSVYAFTQKIDVEEAEFYEQAVSFEALEAFYWKQLVQETITILQEDEDYTDYPSDQKLLAFFYTFFAHTQKNRSRLVGFFPSLGSCKTLQPMRHTFIDFAKDVISQGLKEGNIADRKKLTEKYPQLLFEQFRSLIEFHRKDQSEAFQDTDALIEKSVRFSADIARSGSLDSAFDLGRFLLRRITLPGI